MTFLMTCWIVCSSAPPRSTRLFSLSKTFANIDILDDSAFCWSIENLEQRITMLFSLSKTLANLWFVWFGSDLISALVKSHWDNICSAFKESKIHLVWPSSTAMARQDCSCLIVPRQRLRAPWRRPHRSCRKLCACHRVDHPPCPHRRSCGRRRPHP